MASKLVEMKEAASMLGITPDELNELRSRGEIHGYRDGATWKFKMEEIQRVADEREIDLGSGIGSGSSFGAGSSDLKVDDGLSDDDLDEMLSLADIDDESDSDLGADSILVTEEPRQAGQSTSSTIIGKAGEAALASDSDIMPSDSDQMPVPGEGDVQVAPTANGSDIELVSPGSDAELETDSGSGGSGPSDSGEQTGSTGDLVLEDSSDEFELDSDMVSSSTGNLKEGLSDSDLSLESDLSLADDELGVSSGSGLALGEDEDELEVASADDLRMEAGPSDSSQLVLGDEDEGSDLVLGGESDLTLGAGDSGIDLSRPGDSGLSLEEPIELGDSGVDSALELPEESESGDVVPLDAAPGDPDAVTQLKADDEFLLTPVEEAYYDESDSGSQVIALEDSEAAIDQGPAMLEPTTDQPALLVDDAAMIDQLDVITDQQADQMTDHTGVPAPYVPAATPEPPYSIWNVISLTLVLLFLAVSGMLMIDLMRNMWLWDEPHAANTSLMDALLSLFPK